MAKVDVRTYYGVLSSHKRYRINAGSRRKQEYQPVYDMAGVWHLEPTKETDTYLEIQSYADSCDINVLMARYRNGETDVLRQVQGVYGDFANIPTNYAELLNAKLQAEALFAGLSADVRAQYNNSVEQFMAEIGTKSGLEKLGVKFDGSSPDEVKDGDKGGVVADES